VAEQKTSPDPQAAPDPTADGAQAGGQGDAAGRSGPPSDAGFAIVGIGASAGGLAAFEAFLSGVSGKTGMAFVLVQHLAPDHTSLLAELVRRYTPMKVYEVEDGMTIQPDHAYIIPPNRDLGVLNGRLHLIEAQTPRGQRLPIDFLFRSLAQDQGARAVCVVLSGTGRDGTLGARAVKGAGGLVLVQTPSTAEYDGMPRSVIAAGLADFALPPAQMARQIAASLGGAPLAGTVAADEDIIAKICILLRDRTGHDFSQYKPSTLARRIERRMALHQIGQQHEFLRYLQQDSAELEALFHDLLIGVTSFFRDPDAFAALEKDAIPRLFADKPGDGCVRAWVCGCSTGEEAYSIAILLQEHLEQLRKAFKVQVFATDVDPKAIVLARAGVYPASIAADVAPERLARFFSLDRDAGAYRVQKAIRDLVVFSEQDVIKDPPFSRLDLVSCRNLLIYLRGEVQRRLIPLFHYALNPGGILFLGTSESVGEALTLFGPLNRKCKLYLRLEPPRDYRAPPLGELTRASAAPSAVRQAQDRDPREADPNDRRGLTERALLEHFNAAALLVNGRGEIFYVHGRTGQYLEPAVGDAAMNLFAMAREGLRPILAAALQRAVVTKGPERISRVRVKTNGDFVTVDLMVRPVRPGSSDLTLADRYLVVLEQTLPRAPLEDKCQDGTEAGKQGTVDDPGARIAELECELKAKEEYLQATLEEMETANEELKSTNEETQSINEELQSANEELETSKEELQSVNEELATVNAELQGKVTDLSRANNDMNNLLAGTGIATLFVDHELRITRFTPATTGLIRLIDSDIGRPVGDVVSNLVPHEDLQADLQEVLRALATREKEVQTRQGAWYLMRIGPYRTLENVIEGAVITFVDISRLKELEAELRKAHAFAEAIVDTAREPLLVLDQRHHVLSANRTFCRRFGTTQAEVAGRALETLGDGQWDNPALRQRLAALQAGGAQFEDFELEYSSAMLGEGTMLLNARLLEPVASHEGAILLAIEQHRLAPGEPAR